MAIKPKCDVCTNELEDFGAILLSPPDESNNVKKMHICKKCYEKIIKQYDIRNSNSRLKRTTQ